MLQSPSETISSQIRTCDGSHHYKQRRRKLESLRYKEGLKNRWQYTLIYSVIETHTTEMEERYV